MTNREHIDSLNAAERIACERLYRNHPLAKYIDWETFMDSEDGNEMHFVKSLDIYKDEDGKTNYVLDEIEEDGIDYRLVYIAEDGSFEKLPQ